LCASAWLAPAIEVFRLRDVCWNCASSPVTNLPGVEALVAVEEDGVRGGEMVRGDSEGLFKGLAVGLAVFRRCLATTAWQFP